MKRKTLFIILALCLVLAVGILAACNENDDSGQQTPGGENPGTGETVCFTVTFDTQGGSTLADITVENGQAIGEFSLPTKQCSRLVGFALDTAGEQMWNVLTDTVSANITLYAIWEDAHTWSEWADTTPATCTENGERTRECEVCGVTESEVIPAAHTWGEWAEILAPDCDTNGERSHSCEACGKTESEAIDALGHNYEGEYTEDIVPTCENPGSESRHCSRCDATTDSREIAALGHNYEGAEWNHNEANHWRYCKRCGKESERVLHSYDDNGVCECGVIEVAPVNEFRFISLGNNTWRLANYTGNRTNVSIPSTYNNGTVIAISDDAFNGNTAIETLVVPDTVTSIGARAFSGCVNLTSVSLSKNLSSIGEDAFAGCTQITSATIPAMAAASIDKSVLATLHVTSGDISANAFSDCATLVYVTIEYGVTTIGSGAFANCTGISEISVPASVTSIGNGAFSGCSGLVEMTLPFVGGSADVTAPSASTLFGYIFGSSSFPGAFETVQLYGTGEGESATYFIPRYLTSVTVGDDIMFGAFYGCDRIESITLTSATALGDYAFYNNTSLTEIIIPNSVKSIGEMTFAYCTALEGIDFPQNIVTVGVNAMLESAWYDAQPDGVIYIEKAVYDYKGIMPSDTAIELKDDTYSITAGAFSGCTNLTAVTIPDSVSEIGDGAFEGCTNLADVTMPAVAIDYIPQNSLKTVSITRGAIGDNAFEGCTELTSVTIENGVTSIGKRAFSDCSGLRSITISESVTRIGNEAFKDCSRLTSITIPESVRSIGSSTFYNCGDLTSVTIGEGVTSIGFRCFYGCTGLTSITIPDNVTSIGEDAFYNCSGLESITIPFVGPNTNQSTSSRDAVFGYIFGGTTSQGMTVVKVYFTWNDYDIYYIPTALRSVTINGRIISDYAFYGCSSLTSITIMDSVTSVGKNAFHGCGSLRYNEYDNACYLGNETNPYLVLVKAKDTAITSCTISEQTKFIYSSAFFGCTGLTSVTIPDSVTSIGEKAFYNCSGLESITIPFVGAIKNGTTNTHFGYIFGASSYSDNYRYVPTSLKEVVITGEANIAGGAFSGCSSLESITVPFVGGSAGKTASDTYQYPFGYIFGTTSYTGGRAVEQRYRGSSVTFSTYYIPYGLRSVTVTGGNILSGAFYDCYMLTSITIPDDVTSIGDRAFYNCTGLTSITIPDGVTSIGSSAFSGCSGLTSITIPDDVTSIGGEAFYNCTGLTSITIPDSVTSIGRSAFYDCTGLTSVHITDIAAWCAISFYDGNSNPLYYANNLYINNELVIELVIPYTVTSIGSYAFYNCDGLTSITIPDSVTSIGSSAFLGCINLIEVYNKSSLNMMVGNTDNGYVAYYVKNVYTEEGGSWFTVTPDGFRFFFDGTSGYLTGYYGDKTELVLPNSFTAYDDTEVVEYAIHGFAFYNCSGLTSVTIPDSVTRIGSSAFYGCSSLESITIPFVGASKDGASNNLFGYIFGANSSSDNGNYVPPSLNEVVITGGIIIGNYAFYHCSMLTSITIPNSVKSIGDHAFSGCTGLTSITIPDSVTSIGSYAFYNCDGLTSITIPDSVTSIGSSAFSDCSSLESISIPFVGSSKEGGLFGYIFGAYSYSNNRNYVPSSLKEVVITGGIIIGNYSFYNCTMLTSITIPDSVTSIGSNAFEGCTGLTSVIIGNGVTSIGYSAFWDCSGLTSITIPNSVTSIGSAAFSGCSSLESLSIPFVGSSKDGASQKNFEYIFGSNYNGNYAPSSLKEVLITGETSIGNDAFEGCTDLTSVIIGNGVTSIGSYAFEGCTGLTSVIIGNGVTSIGNSAFSGCTGLTSITIPNSVTSLGNGAFSSCTGLTSISIPNSVKSIGENAFSGCSGLTSVTIPDGVTSIRNYAFSGCTGLTSVTIPDGVTSIGYSAFSNCTSLTSITIPDSVTSIGNSAFSGCSGLTSITIPDSVTSIENSAFYNCTGLTSITIPDSVTSIGNNAFSGCTGLTSVTFKETAGWFIVESYLDISGGGTTIDRTGLSDPSTAATWLTSTYDNYYWKRNV